jgi:putative ABC transport system ATP-binding protein
VTGTLGVDILEVNNLSKVYGEGDTQIKALDSVSFGVKEGEFVAIVGPSGSGKSTLLHILGGVDTPSSGQVLVDGTNVFALNQTKLAIFRRRQIGLIYQFYNLIPILNVEENITLPLLLDGRSLDEARLEELVATLGLSDRVGHLPNQLSGGQQQRVAIGRALINNPALVLADEPTGNLDSATSGEIISLLELSNRRYHQTLIVVTHDRDIAHRADRIITFGDGRILRDEAVRA